MSHNAAKKQRNESKDKVWDKMKKNNKNQATPVWVAWSGVWVSAALMNFTTDKLNQSLSKEIKSLEIVMNQ